LEFAGDDRSTPSSEAARMPLSRRRLGYRVVLDRPPPPADLHSYWRFFLPKSLVFAPCFSSADAPPRRFSPSIRSPFRLPLVEGEPASLEFSLRSWLPNGRRDTLPPPGGGPLSTFFRLAADIDLVHESVDFWPVSCLSPVQLAQLLTNLTLAVQGRLQRSTERNEISQRNLLSFESTPYGVGMFPPLTQGLARPQFLLKLFFF